jgi:ligand-binding sensor domain-containing protein
MKINFILTLFFSLSILLCIGQEVKIYDKSNSNIVDNDLWSVATDQKGNIWIGTSKFGLLKFDGKDFTSFNKDNSVIKGDYISPIFCDSKGNVWVVYRQQAEEAIVKYDGSTWKVYSPKDLNADKISVISICEDSKGVLYFGGSNGVYLFKDDKWTTLKIPQKNITIRAIDVEQNGTIALGHNDGLLIYKSGKWEKYSESKSELQLSVVRAVKFKENGGLFVGYGGGMGNGGFSILSNGIWIHYNKTNSKIPDHMVRDVEFDGTNYWMATNNGVIQFNDKELIPILFRDGVYKNTIMDISIENGVVWIATNFGLIKYVP